MANPICMPNRASITPGQYWDMDDQLDVALPPSFGKGHLPPICAMFEAMQSGTDPRDHRADLWHDYDD